MLLLNSNSSYPNTPQLNANSEFLLFQYSIKTVDQSDKKIEKNVPKWDTLPVNKVSI